MSHIHSAEKRAEKEISIFQDGGPVEKIKNIDHLNGKHYPTLTTFTNPLHFHS
jgi:hypothetical protein